MTWSHPTSFNSQFFSSSRRRKNFEAVLESLSRELDVVLISILAVDAGVGELEK